MIKQEVINGNLLKTYSDTNKKLLQVDTGLLYGSTVYDVRNTSHIYKESDYLDIGEEIK